MRSLAFCHTNCCQNISLQCAHSLFGKNINHYLVRFITLCTRNNSSKKTVVNRGIRRLQKTFHWPMVHFKRIQLDALDPGWKHRRHRWVEGNTSVRVRVPWDYGNLHAFNKFKTNTRGPYVPTWPLIQLSGHAISRHRRSEKIAKYFVIRTRHKTTKDYIFPGSVTKYSAFHQNHAANNECSAHYTSHAQWEMLILRFTKLYIHESNFHP